MTTEATSTTDATAKCPVFADFDPLVPHHLDTGRPISEQLPWPLLARARREQPVFYMPQIDMWCVTRYDDIRAMLRDTETFSNAGANEMRTEVPAEITIPEGCPYPTIGDSVANLDPPNHTRVRKLMQYAFTPKRVGERSEQIREIANACIDKFIDQGEVDLVPAYSNPIPIQVIAMVLGFPIEAADRFRKWTDDFLELLANPGLPHDRAVEMWNGLLDSFEYIRNHVQSRRESPENDLISDLLHARSDDGAPSLSDFEIISNTISFVIAGTDTTATQISHMVICLQEDRSRWEEVVADPSLVPNAVEETLRYLGPVRGLNRVVTCDAELGGVKIPQGSRLFWMGAAANRDEAAFENADQFDLHRKNMSHHIGFGALKHFCIGAPLARLEAQIALECLIERLPSLQIDEQTAPYPPTCVMPGPLNLRATWTPPAR
jgi:cytochrome P450